MEVSERVNWMQVLLIMYWYQRIAACHIIRWCHKNVAHGGRGLTLNELRQCGFWIVSASSAIRNLIHRCVVCRKLRGKLGEQTMFDIPKERISNDPPLTYCGVDMFGPFTIKERRSELKR